MQDSVAAFFERRLPEASIREMDRARRIPRSIWTELGEQGWTGVMVPERHGGSEAGTLMAAVLTEAIARRFPSLAVEKGDRHRTTRVLKRVWHRLWLGASPLFPLAGITGATRA